MAGTRKGRRIDLPPSGGVGIVHTLGDSPDQVRPDVIGSESDIAPPPLMRISARTVEGGRHKPFLTDLASFFVFYRVRGDGERQPGGKRFRSNSLIAPPLHFATVLVDARVL